MRLAGLLTIATFALAAGGLLYAQSGAASAPASGSASAKKEGKAKSAILVTPEREAAVLTFVQRNHAELAELLGYLKTSDPQQYERAVKDIFRAAERLAQIQERDPLQYELEVAAWTAQSRVELLAAKLKMGASDDLVKQLRDALKTQNDDRLALLKHDRQKVTDRLSKLEGEIVRFEGDSDDLVNRQVKILTRNAGEGRPAKATVKSPAKGKRTTTTSP